MVKWHLPEHSHGTNKAIYQGFCCRLAGEPLQLMLSELALHEVSALIQSAMAAFRLPSALDAPEVGPKVLDRDFAIGARQSSISQAALHDPAQCLLITNQCPVPLVFSQVCYLTPWTCTCCEK